METQISDQVKIYEKYSLFDMYIKPFKEIKDNDLILARILGGNPSRICIQGTWYDVIPHYILVRSKSKEDDAYHLIYIQINFNTNEYYIGKVNRKKWHEIRRYKGSGIKFKFKYEKHAEEFVQYFIATCNNAKDSEELEAKIVNDTILKDPKCLNLVKGGAGTNEHNTNEDRKQHIREYMLSHPENYQAMLERNKELFNSGNSLALEARSKKIRETMSQNKYREMSKERMQRWRAEHPMEYAEARKKNCAAIKAESSKQKRNKSLDKWRKNHPEEYAANKKKQLLSCHTKEAEEKRCRALKAWNQEHPEVVKLRAEKAREKLQKAVEMIDLVTGEVLMSFTSQREAAAWLVKKGVAKNTNCVSSISAVCLKKPCTNGYRKKAYGYGWRFKNS